MNRPPKEDRDKVRDTALHIRLSKQQRKRWQAKADALGISVAEWIRLTMDRAARM